MATEKRLIDANALLVEIEKVYADHYEQSSYQFIHDFVNAIRRRIRRASTVDVVEVVCCKDCKHWLPYPSLGVNDCGLHKGLVLTKENTYCSYGERKDNGRTEK